MELLTSKENSAVKLFRKLSQSARARREAGKFTVEGLRLCSELVRCSVEIEQLFISETLFEKGAPELSGLINCAKHTVMISPGIAEWMGDTKTPQGVFCICLLPKEKTFHTAEKECYLLLDHLQDPGNLGSIIRSADAFGAAGLILSPDMADPYSPRVLRAAMGSVFRLPICFSEDLCAEIEKLRQRGVKTYASVLSDDSVTLQKVERHEKVAVVIGNEGNGVCEQVRAVCDGMLHIPMCGQTESLNAAAAAAVILWQIALGMGKV